MLVVDDDPLLLELVVEALEAESYATRRASDGLEAVAEIERGGIDLVVADVMMPNVGGIALTEAIREREHRIPVVLMSAVVDRVGLPDVPFLSKPFQLDHLIAAVESALGVERHEWHPNKEREAVGACSATSFLQGD